MEQCVVCKSLKCRYGPETNDAKLQFCPSRVGPTGIPGSSNMLSSRYFLQLPLLFIKSMPMFLTTIFYEPFENKLDQTDTHNISIAWNLTLDIKSQNPDQILRKFEFFIVFLMMGWKKSRHLKRTTETLLVSGRDCGRCTARVLRLVPAPRTGARQRQIRALFRDWGLREEPGNNVSLSY